MNRLSVRRGRPVRAGRYGRQRSATGWLTVRWLRHRWLAMPPIAIPTTALTRWLVALVNTGVALVERNVRTVRRVRPTTVIARGDSDIPFAASVVSLTVVRSRLGDVACTPVRGVGSIPALRELALLRLTAGSGSMSVVGCA